MIESLLLIEGQSVSEEALRNLSLGNAKQLVVGGAAGFGVVLHVAATTGADLNNTLLEFAQFLVLQESRHWHCGHSNNNNLPSRKQIEARD
jgi:hypothetical protein